MLLRRGNTWSLLPALLGVLGVSLVTSRVDSSRYSPPRPKNFPQVNRILPNFSFRSGEVRQITPTKNISTLLDNLLKGYDQMLRPSSGGEPTTVEIDIEVRSMGQISEMDMTYSMDCYFRQSWVDERLSFSHLDEAFTLSLAVLDKLWKPDTYIYNGKQSYVHLITTPNKFIRLYRNGRILYSSRLTINANCPMNLHNFPMDTQRCPLQLGSFAYTTRDVVYRWNEKRRIRIAPDLMLSQFDLIAAPSGFENTTRRAAGEFSTLLASFYLKRHMGNFLIQVYGPCMLLVVLSWVSFWLNREATSDRISLGITTVLTMTFLGLEARTDLPKVSYSTALDLFVWLSYGFIFATIIEFAFVHIFTKVGSGEVYLSGMCSDSDDDDEQEEEQLEIEPVVACTVMSLAARDRSLTPKGSNGVGSRLTMSHQLPHTPPWSPAPPNPFSPAMASTPANSSTPNWTRLQPSVPARTSLFSRLTRLFGRSCRRAPKPTPLHTFHSASDCAGELHQQHQQHLQQHQQQHLQQHQQQHQQHQQEHQQPRRREVIRMKSTISKVDQMNSVSNIDEVSRVLFPLSFLCINLVYWYTYLSHSR